MPATAPSEIAGAWAAEGRDLVRAASGGLLLGVPLLYTMEVWWTGGRSGPERLLVVLAAAFVPVLALNRTAGFRGVADTTWRDAAVDSVETVGIGLVLSAGLLVLLRQIDGGTPAQAALGKVVYEAVPVCLGIAVAHHVLRGRRDEDDDEDDRRNRDGHGSSPGAVGIDPTVADLGASVIGSVFVGMSIAPTDEVDMIAAAMTPEWTLALVAVSLVACHGVVFVAGFAGEDRRHGQAGVLQHPATETIVCYLVALAAAWVMLWFFQRGEPSSAAGLTEVVVLGFPAAIGGAAGRLAI